MHSASTHIYSLSLHDALPIWSQDFRTEPYTVQSHQIIGTVLQSGPKNLRPDRNFSVRSSLDRKLQSGLASLRRSKSCPLSPIGQASHRHVGVSGQPRSRNETSCTLYGLITVRL